MFSLRFLPGSLESGSLLHFLALRVLHILNSPLRQTAEPVCLCISWTLTLFFCLSWRQLPWGSSSHESTREALEPRPQTLHTVYVFSLKDQLPGVVSLYRGIAPMCPCVLYLYPSFSGILTVNSWHLMQTADWKKTTTKKKQGQPQSTVVNVRMCVHTPNKQVCTTTQWSSAGNTFMSSLSLFSHIHLQAHLVQVASVCLTYQKATSAGTQWNRGYSFISQFRHLIINVFRIVNLLYKCRICLQPNVYTQTVGDLCIFMCVTLRSVWITN